MSSGTILTPITPSITPSGAPDAPTAESICAEALKRFYNGGTPDEDEIARAIAFGLEKVKRDIMISGKKWRPLLKTIYGETVSGVYQYANPADFEGGYSLGIVDDTGSVIPLKFMLFRIYDMYPRPGTPGCPSRWTIVPDEGIKLLGLYPTPSGIYQYRQRYYADLCKLDMTDGLYSTILRRWAAVFEQGVYTWALEHNDDDRYVSQEQQYQNMLLSLMAHDLDGLDRDKFAASVGAGGGQ